MSKPKHTSGIWCIWFILAIHIQPAAQPQLFNYSPTTYYCVKTSTPPVIDGRIDDMTWQSATWTGQFWDITGDEACTLCQGTSVKMAWDDRYFYIAATLPERDLWATYDSRDMVIYHENDFEVFIDPDKDTHDYLEIEINALGTYWDLLLSAPYRDKGKPMDSHDVKGLIAAVSRQGTINHPGDRDTAWTVEMAVPWTAIKEIIGGSQGKPSAGDYWKVNFSRVQWQLDTLGRKYIKKKDSATSKSLPEFNCVWSPQGVVDMHQPEKWGLVVFGDKPSEKHLTDAKADDLIRWNLRQIYYYQKDFFKKHGIYSQSPSVAGLRTADMDTKVNGDTFTTRYCKHSVCWYIREDGRIWKSK